MEKALVNKAMDYPYDYEYPWPPRHYTCSFCQREFKSAQALGGHMNIHRRDRARLMNQSPNNNPILAYNNNVDENPNPSLNPNPNYYANPNNFSSSSSPTNNNIYAYQYSLVSLSLSSLPPSTRKDENLGNRVVQRGEFGRDFQEVGKWKDFSSLMDHEHQHEVKGSSTKEVVKLDLELCLGEVKQDLDLELRLGIM